MSENAFVYTYSAKQQEEVEKIRRKYTAPESHTPEDKMVQLRRLDASVTQKGTAVSLMVGVAGTLILGLGMSCCMVWGGFLFLPGILVGCIGMVGVALAYPLYHRITRRERQRIAPEILRLSEELLQG